MLLPLIDASRPAGDALAALGLPPLPEGAGLPLHIGGTPTQPQLEIAR